MNIEKFKDAIEYCYTKRDLSMCPMINKKKECLVKDICDEFGSGKSLFYFKNYVWRLIESDLILVKNGYVTKEAILKKYKQLKDDCIKGHKKGTGSEYCGNNCGDCAFYLCNRYLHNSIGNEVMSVYISMDNVYPIIKYIVETFDDFKKVK